MRPPRNSKSAIILPGTAKLPRSEVSNTIPAHAVSSQTSATPPCNNDEYFAAEHRDLSVRAPCANNPLHDVSQTGSLQLRRSHSQGNRLDSVLHPYSSRRIRAT